MDIKELKNNWNRFGETDPLWSILTAKDKKDNKWNKGDFFNTGIKTIDKIMQELRVAKPDIEYNKALDFGCGVGRLTNPLGDYFREVIGIDIAPSMIKLAEEYKRNANCRFVVNDRPDLSLFQDNSFDFICSFLVLQHMEPRYSLNYLKEFVRILKPGGVLFFNLPGDFASSIFETRKKQDKEKIKAPRMEMYRISKDEIINNMKKFGINKIKWEANIGNRFIYYNYFIIKEG